MATIIGELGMLAVTSSVRRLVLTANVGPSTPILVNLMMEAVRFSETSSLTSATRRHIPEDGILHIYGPPRPVTDIALLCTCVPGVESYLMQHKCPHGPSDDT
jgi:hypothetical protein